MTTKSYQPFLIFLHIQKTGGITLQRILRRKMGASLPQRAIRLFSKTPQLTTLEAAVKSKQMGDRYFAGHVCFGAHRFLPHPYTYIALLREPVSRIVSLYTYSHANPNAYYHKQAIGKTLEEFALDTPLMELDNGQVRFLAGDSHDLFINRTPIGECTTELLQVAQDNIEKHFLLVGLTEYFDHSLLLLQQMLGWNHCFYLYQNVSKRDSKPVVSADLKAEIAKQNWLDVQLYQLAKKSFLEKLEKYNLDQAENIEKFRYYNKVFNTCFSPPYSIYEAIKSSLSS